MKMIFFFLHLLVTPMTGFGMLALPPACSTNEMAEIGRLNRLSSERQNYYEFGRIDRLEHEVDRLETGFVVVDVLIGSTLVSLLVLATRDRIRKLQSCSKR
jgi:hypothetical protein